MTEMNLTAAAHEGIADAERLLHRIGLLAFWAIVLGFVMQSLILATRLAGGLEVPAIRFAIDLTGGISWSLLVCAGVGIGTALTKARPALAGIVAAIAAPIAVALAKSSQKAMGSVLGVVDQPAALSLATVGIMRGVEYGILAWLLATFVGRGIDRALPYLGTGLAVGVAFGVPIALLGHSAAIAAGNFPAPAQLAASLVNEVVSPLGCATVIYVSLAVGQAFRTVSQKT